MTTTTTVIVSTPVKPAIALSPEAFVSPSELCETQRRNMAADAFAVFEDAGV